jgi:hypothetical protein
MFRKKYTSPVSSLHTNAIFMFGTVLSQPRNCTSVSHYIKLQGFPIRNFRIDNYSMKIYLIVAFLICSYFLLNPRRAMSQKALLLRKVGMPLVLGDRPIPQPGQNQLLVKVLVAGREFDK